MWFSHLSMDLSKGFRHSESQNDLEHCNVVEEFSELHYACLGNFTSCHLGISTCNSARIVLGML